MLKLIKSALRKIDVKLLRGLGTQFYLDRIVEPKVLKHNHRMKSSFLIQYDYENYQTLNELCDKYGSDKGNYRATNQPYDWPSHTFADFYELIFNMNRHNVKSILECGLGTNNPDIPSSMGKRGKPGASLRVWRDFFPVASVIGCDIDKDVLFNEERITTFYCDQTDPKSVKDFVSFSGLNRNSVDIIIDDGLHEFKAGKCFFENTIEYLSHNGFYIIEDVSGWDMLKYKDYFDDRNEAFQVSYVHLYKPSRAGANDNRLVVVRKK